jgi:hypothetical protein
MIVHYSHLASQPEISILCSGDSYRPWDQLPGLPEGVYSADCLFDGKLFAYVLYTFRKDKITCQYCLDKMKEMNYARI